MSYYLGIDIGGTSIKAGIVNEEGVILAKLSDKTPKDKTGINAANVINKLYIELLEKTKMARDSIEGIGIGVPGLIDYKNGVVENASNLGWTNVPIKKLVEELTNKEVRIVNDADSAALGEAKFGAAKDMKNVVMVTIGTGIGSGVIFDGKLIPGIEFGHSVINENGERCSCGRKGCFESYASATALIRDTQVMMIKHRDSKMWDVGSLDDVDGKTVFDYKDDEYAKEVMNTYINKLACGITNIVNSFRAEAIILGGGVSSQGKELIEPVKKKVNEEKFGGVSQKEIKIIKAKYENDAGIIGAISLFL